MECGVWGDSITYGSCDAEGLGWVGRLRKQITNNKDNRMYNFGICGDTSEGLLTRFSAEATIVKPDTVIFAIGINDSKIRVGAQHSVVDIDQFRENMSTLVELAQEYTQHIFIVGATQVNLWFETQTKTSRFINSLIQQYNDVLRAIAEVQGVTYVEVFDVLDMQTDLADGLHPNAGGYDKLAERIGAQVFPA